MDHHHHQQHFEQTTYSEKLPSISVLPSILEQGQTNPYMNHHHQHHSQQQCQTHPPVNGEMYQQQPEQNVVSPPLTPAVSPSSMLLDNLKYQRKYSVDVGPFGFGSGNVMLPHHILQEEYRRSSTCSNLSASDFASNHHHHHHHQQHPSHHHSSAAIVNINPPNNEYSFFNASMDPFSMVNGDASSASTTANAAAAHPSIMQKHASDVTQQQHPHNYQQQQQQQENQHHQHQHQQHHQHQQQHQQQQQKSRRSSRFIGQPAPNVQHKHVCKYSYCGWSFKRYEHLKRHMLVHTGERPHTCPFQGCGKCFSRSDNFHAHYRTHTKKLIQQNDRLPSSSSLSSSTASMTKSSAKKQKRSQPDHREQQQVSQTQPSSSMYMPEYDTTRMSLPSFEIYDDCPPIYSNEDHRQYMRSFNINAVSPYPTSTATISNSSNNSAENNHQSTSVFADAVLSSSSSRDHCEKGRSQTTSSTQLSQHTSHSVLNYHPQQPDYSSAASIASTSPSPPLFADRSSRTDPRRTSSSSSTSTSSSRSSSRHSPSLSLSPSSPNQQQQRQQHQQQQQQEGIVKNHICPVHQCQRRFKRLEHLKRHMRVHTLERPFTCDYPGCNKTFSRSDNLSQHQKTHLRQSSNRKQSPRQQVNTMQQTIWSPINNLSC